MSIFIAAMLPAFADNTDIEMNDQLGRPIKLCLGSAIRPLFG